MDPRHHGREGRSGQGVLEEHVQELLERERDADDERDAGPDPERVAEERSRLEE